jgi:DNA-directed RNA polymerase subunit beta'
VIVVGPELQLHQCGLPKNMALELFKPFIINKLEEKGYVQTVKSAKRLVERERPEVWDIMEEIIKDHPVLLNRAPTLHLLGIQAFYPVLVEGKAIRLHPLVCAAFNADFDGDQMAVHVPLSFEAQLEARILMLASKNLLQPSSGKPIAVPSQDMVIGCYYLTKDREGDLGEGKVFGNQDEVIFAQSQGGVGLHAKIKLYMPETGKLLDTTVGRVLFNQIMPAELGFYNQVTGKNEIQEIVSDSYRKLGMDKTAEFLDKLKTIGFEYATLAGVTVGIDDMVVPEEKEKLLEKANSEVNQITKQYERGAITNGERYNKVIDTWTRTTSEISEALFKNLTRQNQGFNPIYMMADSGARGSKEQIRQLAGMRGLMAKPQKRITGQIGEIIEYPITANFKEGLTVLEYFISTHGARKGLADTALKTADAGYLTRRLVDVAQDVIVTENDCGTILGIDITALKEGEEVIESLRDRILGRVTLMDVYDPITDELIIEGGKEIDEETALQIDESGIESVPIRSVLTCESRRGVCAMCYGRNLSSGYVVDLGEAVGVIAAQSIGEPGTQLTLRTFHIGGTAAVISEQSKITCKNSGTVVFNRVKTVAGEEKGEYIVLSRNGELRIVDEKERVRQKYSVPYGCVLKVKNGQQIEKGETIFEWDPHTNSILTNKSGKVEFLDIIENVTYREELDESTGLSAKVIIEQREKALRPHIAIVDDGAKRLVTYSIPVGAHLMIKDGEDIRAGQMLVKIPRELYKTKDITGGLPRVAELFEARHPKDPAVVTEIDGGIEYGKVVRGNQQIIVHGEHGEDKEYLVPHGKHLLVHDNDQVLAGDRLCEGPIDPHDILKIKGPNAVQEYLVNEIQGVYRLQGVKINDKHIEVIVRQVLQKVKVMDVGDTNFLEGEVVDKNRLNDENDRVLNEGGNPATYEPLLLGITKASLSTESFISAASFQETTRVLTEAAINGKADNLLGLKENVIIGRLIPAGTGLEKYNDIDISGDEEVDEIQQQIETVG